MRHSVCIPLSDFPNLSHVTGQPILYFVIVVRVRCQARAWNHFCQWSGWSFDFFSAFSSYVFHQCTSLAFDILYLRFLSSHF